MADVGLARHDEALLAALGAVLGPPLAEPPVASVTALRASVQMAAPDRRRQGLLARMTSHWRRVAAGAGIVVGVLAGGTGAAFASGSVPEPVRAVAYDLGLPVDSPALSAARHDESRLRHALAQVSAGDTGSAVVASADARALAAQLARLDKGDRQQIGSEPLALIAQARSIESRDGLRATAFPGSHRDGTVGTVSGEQLRSGADAGSATSGTSRSGGTTLRSGGGGTAVSGGGTAGSRATEGGSTSGGTGQDQGDTRGTSPGPSKSYPGGYGTGGPSNGSSGSNGQTPPATGGREPGAHHGFRSGGG